MVKVGFQSVVGYKQVLPALVVVVGGSHGEIFSIRLKQVHGTGDFLECAVSVVVIEGVRAALVGAGRTAAFHAANVAVSGTIGIQRDITANVKIEVAIVIVIEKRGPTMKRSRFHSADA